MSKTLKYLEKQLKTEHKQDAEDCLLIYNKLKEINHPNILLIQNKILLLHPQFGV